MHALLRVGAPCVRGMTDVPCARASVQIGNPADIGSSGKFTCAVPAIVLCEKSIGRGAFCLWMVKFVSDAALTARPAPRAVPAELRDAVEKGTAVVLVGEWLMESLSALKPADCMKHRAMKCGGIVSR